jgi:chromosome segregation ATPase
MATGAAETYDRLAEHLVTRRGPPRLFERTSADIHRVSIRLIGVERWRVNIRSCGGSGERHRLEASVEDLVQVLTKFHREIVLPDIERIVGAAEIRLRDEMQTGFDALAQRLDRLETEYHMLVVGLKRVEDRLEKVEGRLDKVEQRLDRVEQKLDKMALRSELVELKARVDGLQEQVHALETRLGE